MYNVHVSIEFVWDEHKNVSNQRKHGVSFEEASSVFSSTPFEVFHDPDHSEAEDRYIAVGFSAKSRCLIVVHCENEKGTQIRIISARKASRKERVRLFGGRGL